MTFEMNQSKIEKFHGNFPVQCNGNEQVANAECLHCVCVRRVPFYASKQRHNRKRNKHQHSTNNFQWFFLSRIVRQVPFTCNTTTTMANSEIVNTHAEIAMAVIAVVVGVMWPNPLFPFASLAVLNFPFIPNGLSSPNCCCSTMRRLPAGDALMHPPVK